MLQCRSVHPSPLRRALTHLAKPTASQYELGANVLRAWPPECEGAYLCCLSNPQNLDITEVLNHPDGSPFERVLGAEPRPSEMLMLANRNTPIHSRLWCVLEAHVAREKQIQSIRIEGPATQLLTGTQAEALKQAELNAEEAMAAAKKQAQIAFEQSLEASNQGAKRQAEAANKKQQQRIGESHEALMMNRLEVLLMPANELIDLESAQCSYAADATRIREQIAGSEIAITDQIAELIRDNVCGVRRTRGHDAAVDGPLGRLPLEGAMLDLKDAEGLSQPSGVMQLVQWLRSRPAATDLTLSEKLLLPQGVDVVFAAM